MAEESKPDSTRARKILMGTCGWSDQTLLRCGKFYPASVRTAEDRLRHYSTHFPCVEVDTSTYAIPSPVSVARWVKSVTSGFIFHFKAFGLFCSKSGAVSTIPGRVRGKLELPNDQHVKLYDLPGDVRDEIWGIFNAALRPAYDAGQLGVVVFQFHLTFKPSKEHREHVLWCRRNLDSKYPMAVEFRCRDWFLDAQKTETENWLSSNGVMLIAADELQHETYQRDREQTGLPAGQRRAVLPVAWPCTGQDFLYIRLHRREGNQRLLPDEELEIWEKRLVSQLPPGFMGPIYFMWGTDWEDQPMINAKRLAERLPKDMVLDWKSIQKSKNKLQSMFNAVSSKAKALQNNDAKQRDQSEEASFGSDEPAGSSIDSMKTIFPEREESNANCPALSIRSEKTCPTSPKFAVQFGEQQSSLSLKAASNQSGTNNPDVNQDSFTGETQIRQKRAAVGSDGDVSLNGADAVNASPGTVSSKPVESAPASKSPPMKKSKPTLSTPSITSFFKPAMPNG